MDLSILHKNKMVSSVVSLFLVLYAGMAKPKLPVFIKNAFENPMFRVAILSLVVYRGNKNPTEALMIAVAFTVTMNALNEQKTKESFADIVNNEKFLPIPGLKYEEEDTKEQKNKKNLYSGLAISGVIAILGFAYLKMSSDE